MFKNNTEEQINQNKDLETIFDILQQSDEDFLNKQINTSLFKSVRAPNAFERNNIITYGDILKLGKEGLYNIPWLGRKSLKDIARVIELEKNFDDEKGYFVNYRAELVNQLKNHDYSVIENDNLTKEQFDLLLNELNTCIFSFLENKVTERRLLIFKYRLLDNLTLEQIGAKFGVTRERIRQLVLKVTRTIEHSFCTNKIELKSPFINEYFELLADVEEKYIISAIENLIFTESIHSTIAKRVLAEADVSIKNLKTKPLPIEPQIQERTPRQNPNSYSKMPDQKKEFIKSFTYWVTQKYPEVNRYFLYGMSQYKVPKVFSKPLFWFVQDKDANLQFKFYNRFGDNEKPDSVLVNLNDSTQICSIADDIMARVKAFLEG